MDNDGNDTLDCHFLVLACHIFDTYNISEIKQRIVKYTETVELINAHCLNVRYHKAVWALAMATSPDWYGDPLSDCLQNSMLVVALMYRPQFARASVHVPDTLRVAAHDGWQSFLGLSHQRRLIKLPNS